MQSPSCVLTAALIATVLTGRCLAQAPEDDPVPADPFPAAVQVPDGILDGGSAWFNTTGPISLRELRGKIVVLDFWTYCCINCLHVLPDLRYLEEKYADQIVVIGVHSAKFDNEKVNQNIRDAIQRYEIRHPVVNDDRMLIWQKFGTRAWPTLALVDPEGRYIGSQSGEGHRELFDQLIERLIKYHRHKGTLDETPLHFELEENRRPPTPLRYPGKILPDDATGQLFITDSGHNRIVICDQSGNVLHVIGSGQIGQADGSYTEARFDHPQGLALRDQKLYVADTENHLIRVVDLNSQQVATLAGTGRQGRPGTNTRGQLLATALNSPWDLEIVGDRMFIAMAGPHQIWSHEFDSGLIGVHAGSAREDVLNGPLAVAAFAQPSALVADSTGESLYVADSEGSAVRRVATRRGAGGVQTVAGTSELPRGQSLFAFGDVDGIGAAARFQHPLGLAIDGTTLFVADSYNHKIKRIDLTSSKVSGWQGTGQPGNGIQPLQLNEPGGLAISADTLWIADTNNHRIVAVDRQSGTARVLSLAGLKPPVPVRSDVARQIEDAVSVPPVTVGLSDPLTISVTLNVPDNYKLNELMPVTWEIREVAGDSLVAPEILDAREIADVDAETATARFQVPPLTQSGDGVFLIQMNYGYCSDQSHLCRLATAAWRVSLTASEDAQESQIRLSFPGRTD